MPYHNLRYLALAILLCATTFAQAQKKENHERCGTDAYMEQLMQDPDFAKKFLAKQKEIHDLYLNRSSVPCITPIIVPVAVHYNNPVTIANTACLIDAAEEQIAQLNLDFSSCNANASDWCNWLTDCPGYFSDPNGGDVMPEDGVCIQFCLADQNLPAGEDNIGGFAITVGDYTWPSVPGSTWDDYFNIFVSDGTTAGVGSGVLGIAPLNGGSNPNGNGVYVLYTTFGSATFSGCSSGATIGGNTTYSNGATLTHEAGHYFGLQHTFSDNYDDTPPQSSPNFGCPTMNTGTCTTSVGNDFSFNFMDYVDDDCMSNFSADQATIMGNVIAAQTAWETNAISCYNDWTNGTNTYSSCQGECAGSAPTASFTPASGAVLDFCGLSECIDYVSTSTGSPTSYTWTFAVTTGDLVLSSTTSTVANPSLCFTSGTAGTVSTTLTVTNANGSDNITQTADVTIANCTNYCQPNNTTIVNNSSVTSTISIASSAVIDDLNVDLLIDHTYVGDLTITLSHAGTSVVLVDRPGVPASSSGCSGNDIDCTLDDESTNGTVEDVCAGTSPTISGTFASMASLSAFDGLDQQGIWTLTIDDAHPQDGGTLDEWCMTIIEGVPTVPCLTAAMLTGLVAGVEDYESMDFINTIQVLRANSQVDYDAADEIILDTGFETELGAIMEAFIDGCNNGSGGVNLQNNSEEESKN